MSLYATTFIDHTGRRRSARIMARDPGQLKARLRAEARWLVSAQPIQSHSRLRVRPGDLIPLLQQLELQLRAGVTADAALAQLAADAPAGPVGTLLRHIHREVAQGRPIHEACRYFVRVFPPHLAAVIAAGEASARLPVSLQALIVHLRNVEELRRTARRALIYPGIVLTATTGLVGFLLGGVVPRFAEIFVSLHLPLPVLTELLIGTSEWLRTHATVLGAAGLGLGLVWGLASRSAELRWWRDAWLLRLPVLGETLRLLATARFAAHCRLLHEAGIPLLESLRTGAELTGHALMASQLLTAREAVSRGRPLYAALPKGHAFPSFMIPALKAGETTGQLGAALQQIEDYAATRARERLATALTILEPALLGGLTLVVGAIALAFFLPLMSLLGGLNPR